MMSLPPPVVSLATAAASGALTLLRPADWRPAVRRAYVWLPGAAVAGGVLWATRPGRKSDGKAGAPAAGLPAGPAAAAPAPAPGTDADGAEREPRKALAARALVSVTAAVIITALQAGFLKVDADIERRLAGYGLRHPRRWMAAGAAAVSLALDVVRDASESGRRKPRD